MKTKERVQELLGRLHEDCSMDDILYRFYVIQQIDRGLTDVEAGRTIPQEEVAVRRLRPAAVRSWEGGEEAFCGRSIVLYMESRVAVAVVVALKVEDDPALGHTRWKESSPSPATEQSMRSPARSHSCSSGGRPAMTPSGVPVKITSPGSRVKKREM